MVRRRSADPPVAGPWARGYVGVVLSVLTLAALAPSGALADLAPSVIGLATVVAILLGTARYRPEVASAWFFIAAAQSIWVLVDAASLWHQNRPQVLASESLFAALPLLGYPLFVVGLVLLINGHSEFRRDPGPALDSATIATALGLVAWVALDIPGLTEVNSPAQPAVTLGYLAFDVVLVAAVIRLMCFPGKRSPALGYLLVGLALVVVVDTLNATLAPAGDGTHLWSELLRMGSSAAWGAAALHPSMRKLAEPASGSQTQFRGVHLTALTAAALVAPGILSVQKAAGSTLDVWPTVLGSVVMVALVIIRMGVTVRRIASVHHSLEVLQDELSVQATHDPLTGLANRTRTMHLLARALGRATRHDTDVALLFLDLDGFKDVNDSHGHRAGDEVLRHVARRMEAELRDGDFLGRLGGDEFLIGIDDLPSERDAVALANRLIAVISAPIQVSEDVTANVGASVGIAIGRGGSTAVETLLHEADVATYQAKDAGRGRVEVFSSQARAELKAREDMQIALARAIEEDELILYYQPIYDLRTGQVESYEALVRWDRPAIGLVPPDDFLPLAESSDLIYDLDVWVLNAAIGQLDQWNTQRGDRSLRVAVNVSGKHVSKHRIQTDVVEALQGRSVLPHQLVIEVTETAPMDGNLAATHLEALRRLGVIVSLDDFGTGYQSSAQLSRLPIDVVKVDRQFVGGETPAALALLELMIRASQAFGVQVIAEGIETAEQLERVIAMGCEFGQGFHLGRPEPARNQSPPGPLVSNVVNPSSSSTGTPSSSALSAFDPAFSPTTT